MSDNPRVAELQLTTGETPPTAFDSKAWLGRYQWAVALAGYLVLTLIFTFPLIVHLGDAAIWPYKADDNLWYAWYPWQFRSALAAGQDPTYTHLMYALVPRIQLFADSYYSGVVGAALLTFMTPLAVYNVLVVLTFVLSGFTMYLAVNELVPNRWACFIAGFLYTFSTFHFWHATGQLTLATMQWLPLAAWRVFAFYRRPTWRNAMWMGLALALLPLSDPYQAAYFTLPFGLLFVGGLLIANRRWLGVRRNLVLGGAGLAIAAIATLPLMISSLHVEEDMRAAVAIKSASTQIFSANLLSYVFPHPANPLFGSLTARFYRHMSSIQYPIEQSNYLGIVTVGLAAAAWFFVRNRTRSLYFWMIFTVATFVLSLGPRLQIGGHILFPLPFYGWLYNWPVLNSFRAPNRFGSSIMLGACVLAGYTLNSLFRLLPGIVRARTANRRLVQVAVVGLGVVVMGASLVEHIQFAFPFPTTQVHVPSVYSEMAADPVPGLVLTLPVYPRGTDLFYQTVHHRGLVGGYPIRTSYSMIRSFENVPYVSLFDWSNSEVANDPFAADYNMLHDIFPLPESMKQGLQEYGIRYVMLRTDSSNAAYKVFPPVQPWMRPLLEQQLGKPYYDNAGEKLTVWRIDPGTVSHSSYQYKLGPGWQPGLRELNGTVVRFVLQGAQLNIFAPQSALQHIVVTASAAGGPHTMLVSVNGVQIKTADFARPKTFQSVDLGMVPLHAGQNVLEVRSAQPCTKTSFKIPPTLNPDCDVFAVAQVLVSAP